MSVEEKLVRMKMDNADLKRKAAETTSVFEKLKNTFKKSDDLQLENASKALTKLQNDANKVNFKLMEQAANTIIGRFSVMGEIGTRALHAIIDKAKVAAGALNNMFITGPIKQGFQEYELNMRSIQTMLANVPGSTTKAVNKALDDLNNYADLTIYSFKDMVDAVGRFTTAGLGIDESKEMIKGLSNHAAVAGANTEQLSRAFIQLSQGLSAGSIKLRDWMSIENATLSTKKFRDALQEAGVELGTLESKMDDGKFRESLADGWLTKEVMAKVLKEYASDKTMLEAATKIRTFTQMIDTLKESIGSGWMQTFRTLIGDFDQATELFTNISTVITGVVDKISTARNDLVNNFVKLGGRKVLIDALFQSFEALGRIFKVVGQAWSEVFPKMTSIRLLEMANNLRDLMKQLTLSEKGMSFLKTVLTGLFSAFSIVRTYIIEVKNALMQLFTPALRAALADVVVRFSIFLQKLDGIEKRGHGLTSIIRSIGNGLAKLGDVLAIVITYTSRVIQNLNIQNIINTLTNGINKIKQILNTLKDVFIGIFTGETDVTSIFDILQNTISKFVNFVKNSFKNIDINKLLLSGGLIGAKLAMDKLSKSIGEFNPFKFIRSGEFNILNPIKSILENTTEALDNLVTRVKGNKLIGIAIAITALSTSLILLSKIDSQSLIKAVTALSVLSMILSGLGNRLNGVKLSGVQFVLLSISINKIAKSLKMLSNLSNGNIATGILGLSTIMFALVRFSKAMDGIKISVKSTLGIILLTNAIRTLSKVISSMGNMNSVDMLKGLIGMTASITSLAIAVRLLGSVKIPLSSIATVFTLAITINLLTIPLLLMSRIPFNNLMNGLIAIGSGLLGMAIAARLLSNVKVQGLGNIFLLAEAMRTISKPILALSEIPMDKLITGLSALGIALGGIMVALAIGSSIGSSGILFGTSLLIIAAGLSAITPHILLLSGMSWDTLIRGIGGLTLALAAIGITAGLLGSVAGPAMISFGLGLSSIALSFVLFGAGAALFGIGLAAIVTGIQGVIQMLQDLSGTTSNTANNVSINMQVIGEVISGLVTALAAGLVGAITGVLTEIAKGILDLLQLLVAFTPAFIQAAVNLIVALALGIAQSVDDIVDAALKLAIGFIAGMAKGIRDNADHVMLSIGQLIDSIIILIGEGLANLIESMNLGWLTDGMINDMRSGLEKMKQEFDVKNKDIEDRIEKTANKVQAENKKATSSFGELGLGIDGVKESIGSLFEGNGKNILPELNLNTGLTEQLSSMGVEMDSYTGLLGDKSSNIASSINNGFSNIDLDQLMRDTGTSGIKSLEDAISKVDLKVLLNALKNQLSDVEFNSLLKTLGLRMTEELDFVSEDQKQTMSNKMRELANSAMGGLSEGVSEGAKALGDTNQDAIFNAISGGLTPEKFTALGDKLGFNFSHGIYQGEWMTDAGVELLNQFQTSIESSGADIDKLSELFGIDFGQGLTHHGGQYATEAGSELMRRFVNGTLTEAQLLELSKILGVELGPGMVEDAKKTGSEAGKTLSNAAAESIRDNQYWPEQAAAKAKEAADATKKEEEFKQNAQSNANAAKEGYDSVSVNDSATSITQKIANALIDVASLALAKASGVSIGQAVLLGVNETDFSTSGNDFVTKLSSSITSNTEGLSGVATTLVTGITTNLTADKMTASGEALVTGFTTAIKGKASDLVETGKAVASSVRKGISDVKFDETGTGRIDNFISGIKSKASDAVSAGKAVANYVKAGMASVNTSPTGASLGISFANGVSAQSGKASFAGLKLAQSAVGGMRQASANDAGYWMGVGFGNGISSSSSYVNARAAALASAAANTIRRTLGVNSPAKKLIPVGSAIGEGLMVGIGNISRSVLNTAGGLASRVTDTVMYAVQAIQDQTENDLTIRPVISPEWDLSRTPTFNTDGTVSISGNRVALGNMSVATRGRVQTSGNSSSNVTINNEKMLDGATFYIREEADINKVATEITRIQKRDAELNHLFNLGKG